MLVECHDLLSDSDHPDRVVAAGRLTDCSMAACQITASCHDQDTDNFKKLLIRVANDLFSSPSITTLRTSPFASKKRS